MKQVLFVISGILIALSVLTENLLYKAVLLFALGVLMCVLASDGRNKADIMMTCVNHAILAVGGAVLFYILAGRGYTFEYVQLQQTPLLVVLGLPVVFGFSEKASITIMLGSVILAFTSPVAIYNSMSGEAGFQYFAIAEVFAVYQFSVWARIHVLPQK